MEPSPTAEATRFTFPDRASPTTKTPGRLVSSIQGRRESGHGMGASELSRSRPVRTNPFPSRDTQPGKPVGLRRRSGHDEDVPDRTCRGLAGIFVNPRDLLEMAISFEASELIRVVQFDR